MSENQSLSRGRPFVSILLELHIIPFSIFHLKNMPIYFAIDISIENIFNTDALKRYMWFLLYIPHTFFCIHLNNCFPPSLACVAGAKRGGGGGRGEGEREGSACSKSLCFCITPTNFLVIRLRLLSIKCRYTRQSERKAEPCGYAEIYLICRELTLHKYLSKREILTSGQAEI